MRERKGIFPAVMGLIGLLLAAVTILAEDAGKRFTFSREPNRAVLLVAIATPQEAVARSMTLYGDGRLLLLHYGAGRQLMEEHVLQLETAEIEALLRIAADHDIPDYDAKVYITRQNLGCKSGGEAGHLEGNRDIIHVNVALDSYTSYDKTRENIFVRLRVDGPRSTIAACPRPEYRGIRRLIEQLHAYWKKAGGSPW